MTIALAVLATYWVYQVLDNLPWDIPNLFWLLTPAVAFGMLMLPGGFLLPLAIASVVTLLRHITALITPRVQTTVQRTRRSAVPPIR